MYKKLAKFRSRPRDLDYVPLTYFCIAYYLLFALYLRAKFEVYSFSRFKVIHSGPQILNVAIWPRFRSLWPSFALVGGILCRQCEVCSYSHSGNINEIPKFKSRSRWPNLWPLLTYFCTAHFLLLTVYLCAKFGAFSFSRWRNILRAWYSFSIISNPGGMEGWVGLGTTAVSKQFAQDRYVTEIIVVSCLNCHAASLGNWNAEAINIEPLLSRTVSHDTDHWATELPDSRRQLTYRCKQH